jgi:hypothetical protein
MKQISLRTIKPNLTEVTIGSLDLYYSYETVIAFRDGVGLKVSQNCWSNTTGRHISLLESDKAKLIKSDLFDDMLLEAMKRHNLTV